MFLVGAGSSKPRAEYHVAQCRIIWLSAAYAARSSVPSGITDFAMRFEK